MHINIQYRMVSSRAYGRQHRCTESAVTSLEEDKWNALPRLTRDSIYGSYSAGHHQWVIGVRSTTNQKHPYDLQMKTRQLAFLCFHQHCYACLSFRRGTQKRKDKNKVRSQLRFSAAASLTRTQQQTQDQPLPLHLLQTELTKKSN